jgi:hypothetical protein
MPEGNIIAVKEDWYILSFAYKWLDEKARPDGRAMPAQEGSMTSSIDGPGHVRLSLVGHSGPNLFITSRPEDEAPS